MYAFDANAIMIEPIKFRQAKTITEAWIKCYKHLNRSGYAPILYVLDNEFSSVLQEAFDKSGSHVASPDLKWALNVWIALSAAFTRCLYGAEVPRSL